MINSSTLKKVSEYTSVLIISVIILLLFNIILPVVEPFLLIIIILLLTFTYWLALFYYLSDDLSHQRWIRKFRKFFQRKRIIGIIKEDECKKIKSRFSPEDWETFLGEEYKYEYITSLNLCHISDKFNAIINPYGECYPEKDILGKTSFKKIKEYVKKGGIFVSIAGCPFWFNWNKLSIGSPSTAKEVYGISGDTTPTGQIANITLNEQNAQIQAPIYKTVLNNPIYNPKPVQSLVDTLSFNELGILTTTGKIALRQVYQSNEENDNDINFFGDLANVGGTDLVFEFRAIRKPVQSCVPILHSNLILRYEDNRHESLEIYPLASVPFGDGHFIFTGMHMDVKSRDFITFIDEDDNEIEGHILEDEADEIINAQAEKVCQALRNLLNNRDRIRAYIAERQ